MVNAQAEKAAPFSTLRFSSYLMRIAGMAVRRSDRSYSSRIFCRSGPWPR